MRNGFPKDGIGLPHVKGWFQRHPRVKWLLGLAILGGGLYVGVPAPVTKLAACSTLGVLCPAGNASPVTTLPVK